MNGTGAGLPKAAPAEADAAARDAVRDAALRGLCREGREALAADVLRRYGIVGAEERARRLVGTTRP